MTTTGNLPLDIAPFIGRQEELDRGFQLLSRVRLVTLTGPGGVGKTRLALRLARRLQDATRDAVWMIDLGVLQDPSPERLYARLALAMGIRHHGPAGLDVLLDHLRTRRVLLVLDCCEHLVPVTRTCVTALLCAAPHVRVLATSRQPLGADGEHTLVVPPLPLADAVDLFTTRAVQAGAASAALTDKQAIADLCARLDGLPLAIGLAAGRIRTLSAGQLLSRIDDRFRLLTAPTADDGLERHSTMERVVDWSHALCTEAEQRLWARASVFARGFDLSAAEAVCGGDGIDPDAVVDLIAGLVDKSVLTVDHTTGTVRYSLLDTLRDYGLRRLAEAGETRRARTRHRDHYLDLCARSASGWLCPDELHLMGVVYADVADVLAAIDHCVAEGDLLAARTLSRDLVRVRAPFFWGFLDVVYQHLQRVIDASAKDPVTGPVDAAERTGILAAAGWIAVTQGRYETWRTLVKDAHALLQQWGLEATAPVLFVEGGGEALSFGDPHAIGLLAEARTAFTGPYTQTDQHQATMMWAMATAFAGTPAEAVAASAEYLDQSRAAGAPWSLSWALWTAALAALRCGDHARATEYIDQSLRLQREMDDHWGQTWSIELCAWVLAAGLDRAADPVAQASRAAWLLGAARVRQDKLGVTLAGLRPLADGHAACRERLVKALNEAKVAEAMRAGARGHENAVRVAVGEPTPRRATAATGAAGLTNREREIAGLVAEGRTSAQIGAELRIGARTVDVHVGNIMRKLGVHNRAAIAAWAASRKP